MVTSRYPFLRFEFDDMLSAVYAVVACLCVCLGKRSDLKFSTQVGCIKSYQTNKKITPKGAWLWSRDAFNFLLPPDISPERLNIDISIFTARRLAKRGICRRRVSVCLSVCLSVCVCVCVCHTPLLYQNG